MVGGFWDKLAKDIRAFVENPVTNLVKGVILLTIGLSEVSHTIRDDVVQGHVRVGHGLIIIGFFSILDVLPRVIEGLQAWAGYLEHRSKREKNG